MIAGILIAAGLLKASDTIAYLYNFGLGASTLWASLPVVFLEIVLGIFLLRHPLSFRVWALTAIFFTAFLLSNLFAIVEGKHSCNCFGAVVSRPFYVAMLDLVVLVACVVWLLRKKNRDVNVSKSTMPCSFSATSVLAITFVAVSFSLVYLRESYGVAPLIGLPPVIGRIVLDTEPTGNQFVANLSLASRASGLVVIHGMQPSCSMSIDTEFPIRVEQNFPTTVPVHCRNDGDATVDFVSVTLLVGDAENVLHVATLRVPIVTI